MSLLLDRLIDAWRRRRLSRPRYRRVDYYESQSDVPDSISRSTLVIVGNEINPKWTAFECPCGRGHRVLLNLSPVRSPQWRIDGERLTIYPSIDSLEIDRCHFWVRNGRVDWV